VFIACVWLDILCVVAPTLLRIVRYIMCGCVVHLCDLWYRVIYHIIYTHVYIYIYIYIYGLAGSKAHLLVICYASIINSKTQHTKKPIINYQ